ncbi:hypothetical protein QYF61_020081 [Mycteria americana]|uniref:Uncharacterized protein n=1 Tax=Mycteria americana TaxID=33587 RepID=A0AAN7N336_MYCAM|nr:hypothetical protein QYF61_020081 [Mycteria americana]
MAVRSAGLIVLACLNLLRCRAQAPPLAVSSNQRVSAQLLGERSLFRQASPCPQAIYFLLEHVPILDFADAMEVFDYKEKGWHSSLKGWRLNHFPGQSVPMLDNPLGEEKFPNIQSKPPLAQLEAISSCPITCYLGEETDPHLSTTSFQAKQSQLPQPLLIRLLLQTLHQLRCPSLYTLQYLNIPLVVGGPKLNTVFEVRPHQCRVQGHNHFPSPAGHAIFDTSQDAIGLLGRLGTLLAHIQLDSQLTEKCPMVIHKARRHRPDPASLGVLVELVSGRLCVTTEKCTVKGWRLNHFPGQPVPVPDNRFSEEIFPNILSKLPLVQLEAISSCPITCYLGEQIDTHLATTSFQTQQPQFPQPLLISLVLWTLHQLHCPSLDMLQHLNVSLVVRGPKLNAVFKVFPYQCRVQGDDHFPSPAGHAIPDTSQDAIGLLGQLDTLPDHIQLSINQHSQVIFRQAAFQPLFPRPVTLHELVVMQVQDTALSLVEPHTIGLSPSIQPVQIPLLEPFYPQIPEVGMGKKRRGLVLPDPSSLTKESANLPIDWQWARNLSVSDSQHIWDYLKLNHTTKSIVQMLLELWQAWCRDHFPGEPVPVTDHPPSEEPFPNVQSELPLMQLHSISSCPIADHQREEISTSPSVDPLEEVVDCNEVLYLVEYIGFAWQGFGSVGGYRGGFYEKLLEASPMSDRANASWIQDRPAASQGQANQ